MSARNRGPSAPPMGGGPRGGPPPPPPPIHEPAYAMGPRGSRPHLTLLEEMREAHYSLSGSGPGPRQQLPPPPPHPAIIHELLATQHEDIQTLLIDNQGLAATHVALRQELEVAQNELQQADNYARAQLSEKESQLRELYEKSLKLENDLLGVNAMRSELMQVNMDIKGLTAERQDLNAQVQVMTQDLGRVNSDLQKIPAMKAEITDLKDGMKRVRAAIEQEKKSFAESFEHGKAMENKLVTMAREMEKLRAELAANAEKRAHSAAQAANPGVNYNAAYVNPESSAYSANPYYAGYGMPPANPMHPALIGAEAYPQYPPGPGAWAAYDPQRAQLPR